MRVVCTVKPKFLAIILPQESSVHCKIEILFNQGCTKNFWKRDHSKWHQRQQALNRGRTHEMHPGHYYNMYARQTYQQQMLAEERVRQMQAQIAPLRFDDATGQLVRNI